MLAMCSLPQGRNNRFNVCTLGRHCTLGTLRDVSSATYLSPFPLLFSILREVWSEASAGHTYMGGGACKRKKRIKELKAASFEWKICLRSFKKTDRKQ